MTLEEAQRQADELLAAVLQARDIQIVVRTG